MKLSKLKLCNDHRNGSKEKSVEKRGVVSADALGTHLISDMMNVGRVFAIIFVIVAHISVDKASALWSVYNILGTLGAPLFLVISGYYFKRHPLKVFLKKKTTSVLIPWVVLGSITYLRTFISSPDSIDVSSWLAWLLGYKTYLYFIPVLVVCWMVFFHNNCISLVGTIAVNILSLIATQFGWLDSIITNIGLTNYLNPLNWIGFFAFGILLSKLPHKKLYEFLARTRVWAIAIWLAVTALLVFARMEMSYFSWHGLLYELLGMHAILGLSSYTLFHNKVIMGIAKKTFAIYILHMMFISLLAKIYSIHPLLEMFAWAIVLGFVYLLIELLLFVSKKLKLEKVYCLVLGIRGA